MVDDQLYFVQLVTPFSANLAPPRAFCAGNSAHSGINPRLRPIYLHFLQAEPHRTIIHPLSCTFRRQVGRECQQQKQTQP